MALVHSRLATNAAKRNDLDTAIAHAHRAHELVQRSGHRSVARAAEVFDELDTYPDDSPAHQFLGKRCGCWV
ncbi:hypothetical protein BN159_1340 [Streptomyces davaonensis JCM 4913]|uniref:Uncharacterized protein n=1 Tax=Streptomyces davaonensis (strain DSM 101723 / JCM 4913 / KCC S-0913 / 768) TaxID=1214101 RepID=K4QZB0_STRDJ|nr:hypothetical protein [Streptomyces davaonensis]CCK25719.1 hypothetical protein BN159_1340 [Streptomyces davaonensis JCM 4913]